MGSSRSVGRSRYTTFRETKTTHIIPAKTEDRVKMHVKGTTFRRFAVGFTQSVTVATFLISTYRSREMLKASNNQDFAKAPKAIFI